MSIVSVLGESAVRSLALALAVWVVLRLLRVQHARIAKRAWTAVLILALAMPALVALHIPSVSFTALWSTPRTIIMTAPPPISAANAVSPATIDKPAALTQARAQFENLASAVTPTIPVPAALRGAPVPSRHVAWWQIGFAAYLAITALLLFRVLLGLALAARLWQRAQSFATTETDLPVRLSMDLRSPATVGHGILLPLEAIEWDPAALSATLAHEEKHVREGDFYLQLAATLHHCFFWISPHAWWLRPQLARLSETICDRAAVTSSGDGLSYAQLLLRFATAEQTPAGMVAMAQSAGLRERVERLIADPDLAGAFRHRRGQAIAAAALLAAVALVAAASVHIVQPQTVVLASPQAPAAPPAMPAAPSDIPPLLAPDTVLAPSQGIGIGEDSGTIQSPGAIVRVEPRVSIQTDELPTRIDTPVMQVPGIETRVIAAAHLDVMPRVVAVGPMAMIGPPVTVNTRVKILAIPHIATIQTDDDGFIELDGRNYAICGPNNDGADHNCSLNGYSLKDHKSGAILFERDGKTYIIDDPALVKQAQEAYARVRELGKQQGELGAKQGKLGAQEGELGSLEGNLGAMEGQLSGMEVHVDGSEFHFEMPKDFDKQVQAFTDSTTRLAIDDKLSDQARAQLEAEQKQAQANFEKAMAAWKAQEPQREAMEKQIREQAEQMRKQMQPLIEKMHELGEKQGELGRLQGELGRQQMLLGLQQREASREANSKIQSLIDQAMKNGNAHPVQ